MSDWKLAKSQNSVVALERLYLKADGKTICREGPDAATLLAGVGGEIPQKLAKRLGLFDPPAEKQNVTIEKVNLKGASPEEIERRSTRPVETKDLKKK